MIEITALEKEIEILILLELNQNDSPLSISDIRELLDDEEFFVNFEKYKELDTLRDWSAPEITRAISKCAERMTREGKLKRHGRSSKYNQEYVLAPAPEVSAKVASLEERVVQLETFINSFATGLAKNLSS